MTSLRTSALACILLLPPLLAACGGGDSPTAPGRDSGGNDPDGNDPGGGGSGNSALTVEERDALGAVFGAGASAVELGDQAVEAAVLAVYAINELAPAPQIRLTGTLRQVFVNGSSQYEYEPMPTDRLVLEAASGASESIVVTDFAFEPTVETTVYREGGPYEFIDLHATLAFTYTSAAGTITVEGASVPRAGGLATRNERNLLITRTLRGEVTLPTGDTVVFDLSESRERDFSFRNGFDATDERGTVTGTMTWNGHAVEVDETGHFVQERDTSSLDGTPQRTVRNLWRTSDNTIVVDGRTLSFDAATVRSERRDQRVNQPSFWSAEGNLRVNGEVVGFLEFAAAPVVGSPGPGAVVRVGDDVIPLVGATLAE